MHESEVAASVLKSPKDAGIPIDNLLSVKVTDEQDLVRNEFLSFYSDGIWYRKWPDACR
jgi:hypothetical protein